MRTVIAYGVPCVDEVAWGHVGDFAEERSRNTKGHVLLRVVSLGTNDGGKSEVPVGRLV